MTLMFKAELCFYQFRINYECDLEFVNVMKGSRGIYKKYLYNNYANFKKGMI